MRRTAFKSGGAGFRRRAAPASHAAHELAREQRLEARAARAMAEARPRAATVALIDQHQVVPAPKTVAQRNPRLRALAKGQQCLLLVPGICTNETTTVVCCHSNLSIHGKGERRKADDHYSAWGCAACHSWLDQGPAPAARKEAAFMAAHLRQVLAWRALAGAPNTDARDRAAVLWALGLLNATPIFF
ncbi:nuclease domain-containing protein [Delftia tsuruhatensis]|uniref:nuclease domain-containing protein n=1 Tax=Delftia tsuruhatensis TaxID=180282 RepID=UPI0031DB8E18